MKKILSFLLVLSMLLGICLVSAGAEEKTVLKWLISTSTADFQKDHGYGVAERIANELGCEIEFELINGTEQLMLIISSGQAYDYVYLSSGNYKKMMEEEALMDLTDLLAQYGNNITESITTLWPAVTVDGGIYAIPSTAAQPDSVRYSIVARQDLLDKIGWTTDKLPKTLDGFTQMLRDIKAAYPEMIPLTGSKDCGYGALISNIASAFGIETGGNLAPYQLVDGNVTFITDNPKVNEYLTYVKGLFDEGLIDAEWNAQTLADSRNKWIGNQAVLSYNSWNGFAIDTMYELYEGMEFSTLPLLEDENGKVHVQVYSGVGAYGGIPVTAEHPAESIQVINALMDWDNHLEMGLGVEGVHYSKTEDGGFLAIQPAFSEEKNISNVFIAGFYREDIYPTYWEVRLQKNAYMQRFFYEQRALQLDGGRRSPVAIAPATGVEAQTSLETAVKESLMATMCGGSMEDFEKVVKKWHAEGGEDVVAFYDAWYKENIAE